LVVSLARERSGKSGHDISCDQEKLMPISQPTLAPLDIAENPRTKQLSAVWGRTWGTFFTEVWGALFAWRHSFTVILTHDFGSIAAQSQATQTVTVNGVRSGDAVIVRPTTAVNGIIVDGTVTADDTVTVRAANYSNAAIDPASQVYRIICLQQ